MKLFVTGRSSRILEVKKAFEEIKSRGHEITLEWTLLPMVKPYEENQKKAVEYAELTIKAVTEADVYIIFVHKDGNGVYAELGAALASYAIRNSPRIFAIGDEDKSAALFNYHPAILWRSSVVEILDEVDTHKLRS